MSVALPIAGRVAPDFDAELDRRGLPPLTRGEVTTLQVNVGRLCNQACHHCHVEAGPKRTEVMGRAVAERVIALLEASPAVATLDLTGGAPELNPHFRRLVTEARRLGRQVIDRCNLTVLLEPDMEDLADFLATHDVEVTASLPCYGAENVDAQRGRGVFDRSIVALQRLNALGYGRAGSTRVLNLVYNPGGPFLPPPQQRLEERYREELRARFGIEFHRLFTLTNMPIRRFADLLERSGRQAEYVGLLVDHFNDETLAGVMCRSLVSVAWDGGLFDCDFNQILDLGAGAGAATVFALDSLAALAGRPIATGSHCFGCTAGAGSSCQGAVR